jgi:DNA-binding MarR family transcriptional regulator
MSKISPRDAHLGYWLRFVSNQVSHAFARKVAAHGVTVAEWVVLREVFDCQDVAPSALAGTLGLTRGAVSKLVDRLTAKKLLTPAVNANDRRYQKLMLTTKGRALVPKLAALADANDREFFGHLDPAARAHIQDAMKDIVARLNLTTIPIE